MLSAGTVSDIRDAVDRGATLTRQLLIFGRKEVVKHDTRLLSSLDENWFEEVQAALRLVRAVDPGALIALDADRVRAGRVGSDDDGTNLTVSHVSTRSSSALTPAVMPPPP